MKCYQYHKLPKLLESPLKPFVDGIKPTNFSQSDSLADIDDSQHNKLTNSPQNHLTDSNTSSIVEFHHANKNMICNDKSHICNPNILNTKLLVKSPPVFITIGKESAKFWNTSKTNNSSHLLWHTKTDLHDLVLTSGNTSQKYMDSNLSLKTMKMNHPKQKLLKISSQLLPHLPQEYMDCENTYHENLKCLKTRIRCDKTYKHIIKEWIADANFYYNKTLDYLSQSNKVTKFKLRDIIKQKYQSIKSNVPNTAIEYSIFNALDAFKKTKDKANLKYKSNHDVSTTMYVDGRCIKNGFIYKENFIKKLKENNPKLTNETDKKYRIIINKLSEKSKIMTDDLLTNKCCIIQYNKQSNKIYLFKPIECENEKPKKRHDIVSIDIGANPFLAFYSKRKCGMVDGEWSAKIKYIFKKQDKLQSKLDKIQKKKDNFYERSNIKKQLGTAREKVKNIVNNVHWQTINYFTKKYNTIILPKTNMKGIIGALSSKAARIIQSYGHYNYRQKMIHKCRERNVKLLLCKEIYTSKTCSWCGNIKEDLGTAKVYECKKCDLKIHRDINGARNIMLRPLILGLASPELNQH